jgi:hypothetical protein
MMMIMFDRKFEFICACILVINFNFRAIVNVDQLKC